MNWNPDPLQLAAVRSTFPGSGSADPDPSQNEVDPNTARNQGTYYVTVNYYSSYIRGKLITKSLVSFLA